MWQPRNLVSMPSTMYFIISNYNLDILNRVANHDSMPSLTLLVKSMNSGSQCPIGEGGLVRCYHLLHRGGHVEYDFCYIWMRGSKIDKFVVT